MAKIKQLNKIYADMKKNYESLDVMFKNHSSIKQKFILSQELIMQGYMLINDKLESVENKRQFNKIIKDIKNGQK